jgi:hypothetical protein
LVESKSVPFSRVVRDAHLRIRIMYTLREKLTDRSRFLLGLELVSFRQ